MNQRFSRLVLFFLNLLVINTLLAACTLEPESAASPTPISLTATSILATATALPTATAVPPTPTLVPVPTATPTAVPSPTPTIDETSSSWLSAVNTVTIYSGPSTEFAQAGTLEVGAAARVLGDSQQDWIPIECPANNIDSCWVLWDYNALYPYEGQPLTLNIPDPVSLQSETSTTVSPDGRWQAQVTRSETVSLTSDWVPFFYVELKVTSLDGSTIWTPVSEWHAGGLGEEDAPRLFHWSQDGRYLYYTSLAYPDGACAFYSNIGDYLDRLDLADGSVAALPPPLARGILALSPDETMMAYLSSQNLVVRDLATAYDASQASLKWQIPLDVTWPTQVSEVIWSPDNQRVLITADHRLEGDCEIAGRSSWELDVTTGILTATSTFVPPAEPTPIPCPTPETQDDITRETFLIFCGGRDHVNIPHNDPLILGDALTVETYVNHFGEGGEETNVLIESFVTFSLSFTQNQVSFCLLPGIDEGDGYGEWVCLSHPQPEPGQWFHLAGSWDGENIYLFYDGKLQAKAAFTGPLFHGPADLILNIGNDWITSAHEDKGFKGYIDELRLSSIGRYNADFEPQNQVTADEFTVGLWHFDEGQGTTTTDESRLENHGILSPFVRWGSQP